MVEYAVVGAGIVGASVAYHLSERTSDPVTVYERGSPASETTAKSVAQFGFYGDATQYRMKRYGMRLYNRFFARRRAHPRYVLAGLLKVADTAEGARDLERSVAEGGDPGLGKVAGTGLERDLVEYVDGDEIDETLLVPHLDVDAVEGALFRPKVGYMSRPDELAWEFLERARENGATVRSNARVDGIATRGGRVTGLRTEDGDEPADEVVCAAGPWNVVLARSAGVEIPVRHTLAPVLRLEPPEPMEYTQPVVNHHEGPYAIHRRGPEELLLGYNPGADFGDAEEYDPDAVGEGVPPGIRDGMIGALEQFMPGLLDAEVVDEWVGVRSQTPDGNPIVGPTGLDGFSIAAFHTSGIQLAPAAGKVVADRLLGGEPPEYADALSLDRFEGA